MRDQRGVTLLDVVIGAMLLAVVVGLAFPGFMVANDTISVSGARDRLERAADQMISEVVSRVRFSRVDAVTGAPLAPPGLTLTRAIRVEDLSDLDGEGAVPWEAESFGIQFRQTAVVKEADTNLDINRDGDKNDQFALGVLEIVEGGTAIPILQRARVMLGLPTYEDDLDGDGVPDALFTLDGQTFLIRLQVAGWDGKGRLITTVTTARVHLRNPQG